MNKFGLKPTEEDPRDYHYKKTFGAAIVSLPDEYLVGTLPIKNQLSSWFCTAFASCVLAELQDQQDFCPEWFFAKEKELSGSPLEDGEDLRTPCQTAKKYGFLPNDKAQFSVNNKEPLFLADNKNWPFGDDLAAASYKKKSYFRVDGNFEEVKQVLYQNKDQKRAILTGVNWYNEWTYAPNGLIPNNYHQLAGGHCVPIIGFKKINGEDRIGIQNSYGPELGDGGIFWFNEEVFNREFTMQMYMFIDTDNTVVPQRLGNWAQILIKNICQLAHL